MKKTCDFCGSAPKKFIIDGASNDGRWAWMCPPCHKDYGKGLGLGRGQKFDVRTGEKVAG